MFDEMWGAIAHLGRDARTRGYLRDAWSPADLELRQWFRQEAARRSLDLREDRNGNLWAWWGDPSGRPGVVTGSHLDSVRHGGAFDGPLGVVSAFAALDTLRARGFEPGRPLGVACFTDEEGARFGVPCMGSRLLTGALDADRARGLTDDDGDSMAEVLRRSGRDPGGLGRDDETLGHVGVFVELHVEQGQELVHRDAPVGVAAAIWPHGRWRFDFHGQANHAGTTRLEDRDDPMLPFARTVLHARQAAQRQGVVATFGRVRVSPNNANAIPGLVSAWLDARGGDEDAVRDLVFELTDFSGAEVSAESWTPVVDFDEALRERIVSVLGGVPVLPTGAGHDAGILASAGVPSAMVFVRNPTGISHSPDEHAEAADCHAGVAALATTLEELCRS
ncbi:allantoate amidohydrolase [Streptosporangium sp. NBC_01756]|uniref:allantoate amidohydrolase n=1 Tax=Streptosporangium sp. NBC_01756 TaxID=2975950 RepID=UPI002DDC6E1B|nr:allantoate amidohydrolase [Streptosporangium sp. NBC_01756]WSC84151.1 allantoate amidohydrolase [Streptosporangium sp. NBC_01756]